MIAKVFLKDAAHYTKGLPAVMVNRILHVLKEKDWRSFCFNNPCQVEKQRNLRLAGEPMRASKSVLLGNARDREGLAWEPSQEDFMIGHCRWNYVPNIGDNLMLVFRIILRIGLLRIFIPLAGVDALASDGREPAPKATDPRKKIHQSEL